MLLQPLNRTSRVEELLAQKLPELKSSLPSGSLLAGNLLGWEFEDDRADLGDFQEPWDSVRSLVNELVWLILPPATRVNLIVEWAFTMGNRDDGSPHGSGAELERNLLLMGECESSAQLKQFLRQRIKEALPPKKRPVGALPVTQYPRGTSPATRDAAAEWVEAMSAEDYALLSGGNHRVAQSLEKSIPENNSD